VTHSAEPFDDVTLTEALNVAYAHRDNYDPKVHPFLWRYYNQAIEVMLQVGTLARSQKGTLRVDIR